MMELLHSEIVSEGHTVDVAMLLLSSRRPPG